MVRTQSELWGCALRLLYGNIFTALFRLFDALQNINKRLDEQSKTLATFKQNLDKLSVALPTKQAAKNLQSNTLYTQWHTALFVGISLLFQSVLTWFFTRKSE